MFPVVREIIRLPWVGLQVEESGLVDVGVEAVRSRKGELALDEPVRIRCLDVRIAQRSDAVGLHVIGQEEENTRPFRLSRVSPPAPSEEQRLPLRSSASLFDARDAPVYTMASRLESRVYAVLTRLKAVLRTP